MKTIKSPSQQRLFDPFEGVISQSGWKLINNGWQSIFRESLLEQMPVQRVTADMSDDEGRPTAELYAMVGLLLIRELYGWTLPQTLEAVLFRTDIQYALNLEPGFDVAQRTIERYLQRLQKNEKLSEEIFAVVTDTLLKSLEVKIKKQRLDSTHVLSDMAMTGRSQMIGVALKRFLHKLEKHSTTLLERVPEALRKRYCKQSDSRIFGGVRTSEMRRQDLQQVAQDMADVITLWANEKPVCDWKIFKTLQTIFAQQCEVRDEFVQIRAQTGGAVIQNTSDLDATYDGHKGPGYKVQISETVNEDGLPNFITSANVQTAVCSDAAALEETLCDLEQRGHLPEELLADACYGSHENVEKSNEKEVKLTAPVPGGKAYDVNEVGYDQFQLNEANQVVACPAGHAPKSTSCNAKDGRVWAQFNRELCNSCPLMNHCRVQKDTKTGQANGRVQFSTDAPQAARRRRHEQTHEFRDSYRWRSGIESTNSGLKRRMGLKRLRVRGMNAVKLAVMLKLTAWNILRAAALRAARLQSA